jgi:hypothetical protein
MQSHHPFLAPLIQPILSIYSKQLKPARLAHCAHHELRRLRWLLIVQLRFRYNTDSAVEGQTGEVSQRFSLTSKTHFESE